MIDEKGYYSYNQILSYNCTWNFVLGDRGRGKSYGAKKLLLGSPGKFVCLYRNISDLEHAVSDWLTPMYKEGYEPNDFKWVSNGKSGCNLLYKGEPKGFFRALSQVNHIKQEWFPDDTNWLFFDEFIPMIYRKLGGVGMSEGECVRVIYKTIDHDSAHSRESRGLKKLRVIMVANPFTWNNPILGYFHILPRKQGIFKVYDDIVCELLPPLDQPTKGIDAFLGDEVNRTQGWMKEDAFIGKRPRGCHCLWSIRVDDRYYALYNPGQDLLYCEQKTRHVGYRHLGSLDGLTEDELCIDSVKGEKLKKLYFEKATQGKIMFENINTKFSFIRDIQ